MSERIFHPTGGRRLTKQSDAGDADINTIVRRARQAGGLPPASAVPKYGDFTSLDSFHGAMSQVREAQIAFSQLPSAVRSACSNDPGVFLEMVHDEEGLQELLELGLDPGRLPESARVAPEPPAPVAPVSEGGSGIPPVAPEPS